MCRATSDGGRRCPCITDTKRRSAYRKALKARTQTQPIGDGGTTTVEVAPAGLDQVWQPDRVRQIADDVAAVYSYADVDGPAAARLEALGGREAAVRIVGQAIAAEAVRRADTTIEQVSAEYRVWAAEAETTVKAMMRDALAAGGEARATLERLRGELVDTTDPQERANIQQRIEVALAGIQEQARRMEEYRREGAQQQRGWHDAMNTELGRLADAYRDVLGEVRPLGGVEPQWAPRTAKKAAAVFGEIANIYPTDWLQDHNDADGPRVLARISKTRAHYASFSMQRVRKKVPNAGLTWQDPDAADHVNNGSPYRGFELAPPEVVDQVEPVGRPGQRLYRWVDYEVRYSPQTGRGWEKWQPDDRPQPVWRRPTYSMQTVSIEAAPEITANTQKPLIEGQSDTYSVASHEMAHRFEAVIPQIGQMEHDFLVRRTTDPVTGEREPLRTLYEGTAEVARPDKFASAYMGKEYPGGRTTHHEVMSMGVQALFSGESGGLVGAHRYDADPDMRAFVLGVLATAGRRGT